MTVVARRTLEQVIGHPLSEPQWTAVSAPLEPGVIVAGAGSGKTTVMAARVVWLAMSDGLAPASVLGLTFTTKAAGELLRRTRGFLAEARRRDLVVDHPDRGVGDPEVSTYHAFAGHLIADHGLRLGWEPGTRLLADGAREQLAAAVVAASGSPAARAGRSVADVVHRVLRLDDALADLAISPIALAADADDLLDELDGWERAGRWQGICDDMRASAAARRVLADLVDAFRAAKRERNLIDFADQVRLSLHLARESTEVRADLRSRFAVVLLDEYQDTSVAQRLLLQEAFGAGHPVTAVGDPCQAIYEWRGASIDNIDRFTEHFPRRGAEGVQSPATRYSLSDNRRSAPAILDLANVIAEPLRSLHAGVEALSAAAPHGPGLVECALLGSMAEEAEWIAEAIAARDPATHPGTAVLARRGSTLREVDRVLRARGIRTHLAHSAHLLAHPAVTPLRAMLELIDDPGSSPDSAMLLAGPGWRIGASDIAALGRRAATLEHRHRRDRGESTSDERLARIAATVDPLGAVGLLTAIEDLDDDVSGDVSDEARPRLRAFATLVRDLRRHRGESPDRLISRILTVTGWGAEIHIGTPEEVADRLRAVAALRDIAARFEGLDGSRSLTAFLARLRDAEEFDAVPELARPAPAGAVTLMTIHGAKGLEFDHVVVAGLSAGLFPASRRRPLWTRVAAAVPWRLRADAPDDVLCFPRPGEAPRAKHHAGLVDAQARLDDAAERRLAYVAITRARFSCLLTGHQWAPGLTKPRGPSEYLIEAREWALGGPGLIGPWVEAAAEPVVHGAVDDRLTWPPRGDGDEMIRRGAVAEAVRARIEAVDSDRSGSPWWQRADALLTEARSRRAASSAGGAGHSSGHLSVSQVTRAITAPDELAADLRRPMPQAPHPRARVGTRFHSWVEDYYGARPMLDLDDLPGAADAPGSQEADLAALREAFARTPYAARQPIAVEVPFTLVIAGVQVRGRIDAVFGSEGSYEVVDWKTGGRVREDPAVRWQLAAYRLAWARIADCDPDDVVGVVVDVPRAEVTRLSDLPGPAEFEERLITGVRRLDSAGDPPPSPPVPRAGPPPPDA